MARQQHLLSEVNDPMMSDASLDLALREQNAHSGTLPQKRNALKLVHRLLRGRYLWLIFFGLLLGGAGGYLGWKRGAKTFASTGAIRIKYRLDDVLGNYNADRDLSNADGFVQDQITYMTSWRVMAKAVQDPEWMDVKPSVKWIPNDMAAMTLAVQDLVRRVKVSQKFDQVQVEVRDIDPTIAVAGAHAIMKSYQSLYIIDPNDIEQQKADPRMDALVSAARKLQETKEEIQKRIKVIADARHSEDLDAEYASRREALERLEGRIEQYEGELAIAKKEMEEATTQPATTQGGMNEFSNDLGLEEASVNDSILGPLQLKESEAEVAVERARRGTNVQALRDAEAQLLMIQEEKQSRLADLKQARASGISVPGVPPVKSEKDLQLANAELESAKPLRDKAQEYLDELGKDALSLKRLHGELADVDAKLAPIENRIDQLKIEEPLQQRVSIANLGDKPVLADKDTRPKFAAVGGVGGLIVATGLVMLLGHLTGKVKSPRDMLFDLEEKPLLGLIPQLEKGQDTSKLAAVAAEYVHRSRTMLEIWARGNGKMVIGVTSPSHGSGNTSVAMSLGVSFATAGIKTLLIDVDFVTNGLTPRLQTVVRRELGRVLLRLGMVSEEKLETARQAVFEESGGKIGSALAVNGRNGHNGTNGSTGTYVTNGVNPSQGANKDKALGAACVKLGFITQDQLERALRVQGREPVGLLDALGGEPLESCVGKTGIRNLSLLPRGNVTPAHAAKLSSHSMRQVLAMARQHYDAIIVDTSAILTSLEAGIVASSVDGMVMTVARGERRARLTEAMDRLTTMGCPMAGAIFNHVLPKDMPPETNIGRVSTMNANLADEETIHANMELVTRLEMLGPLASSVVARVPVLDDKHGQDEE